MAKKQYSGVRESKPGRINDLGTTGKEVEEQFRKGCLKKADRTFAQGLQCQQINSMAALMSLEDAVFISHSPQGCVGCSIMAVDMFRVGQAHRGIKNIRNPRIIVSNVDQKSVVFGGEQKLREAVKKAVERYHPKLAFIYASCASGIIGDDIDAIAYDLQEEYPDTVLVPIQCEYYALEGLSQLMHTIELVQERLNPDLEMEGVVFTMYDARTNLSLQVVENVKNNLNQTIYKTIIPRNVRLAEAPSHGLPINLYDAKSSGAESYRNLAKEIIERKDV